MATPRDASDPDELARREFSKTRKGADPIEVKAHLLVMADEIKRLQRHEAELQASVGSMSAQLDRRESIDESAMAQVLGEETIRIVEAARSAAADIRAKAEDSSARLVKDAQERATRLQQEAIEIRATAAREADELVGTARSQADEMMSDVRRESEELRRDAELDAASLREKAASVLAERTAEAEAEAERIRSASSEVRAEADGYAQRIHREADEAVAELRREADESARLVREDADAAAAKIRADALAAAERRAEEATVAASVEVERAREQGRTMVREARDARERMLRDLAERRKGARQQLEALRAGRERMLEVFASAREALDSATGGFEGSLAAARDAADEAARDVDDDLDESFAELDAEIPGGFPDDFEIDIVPLVAEPGPELATHHPPVDEAVADTPDDGVLEPGVLEPGVLEPEEPVDADLISSTAAAEEILDEVDEERDADEHRSDVGHLRLVEGSGNVDEDDEEEDDDDDEDDDADELGHFDHLDSDLEDDSTGAEDAGPSGNVEEIFARIRAGRGDDDDPGGTEDDDDDGLDGPAAEVISLKADAAAAPDDRGTGDDQGAGHGAGDGAGDGDDADQSVLDQRDDLIEPLEAQLIRQLKRQVSQHENQLLDQMRKRKRSAPAAEALGSVEDFARVIASPLRGLGAQAFAAGVTVIDPDLDGIEFPEGAYDDYAREWVSTALRARLGRALAVDADTADRNEQINRVRATYRDWRNDRLAEAAGDLMTFAFNRGVLAAVGDGAPVRWVVDHGGLPSPDAEDNRLAGAVPAGQPFATGDVAPPSHPGCRCVLTPSP